MIMTMMRKYCGDGDEDEDEAFEGDDDGDYFLKKNKWRAAGGFQ